MTIDPVDLVPNGGWDARVEVLRCGATVDTFAIRTRRFLVLVDTMVSPASMRRGLELLGVDRSATPPLVVVNTHGDWDHVWGNTLFAGEDAPYPAPVIGTGGTVERMRSEEAREQLVARHAAEPERFAGVQWQAPDIVLTVPATIDGGDLSLELIATPGHTPDHLALWLPEIRMLLAGDAAEAPLPFVDDPATLPTLRASLRRMLDLQPRHVLYCHAPGISSADVIRRNIRYFDELEGRCQAARERGGDASQVLREWPLEVACAGMTPDGEEQREFYRGAHRAAVVAMDACVQ